MRPPPLPSHRHYSPCLRALLALLCCRFLYGCVFPVKFTVYIKLFTLIIIRQLAQCIRRKPPVLHVLYNDWWASISDALWPPPAGSRTDAGSGDFSMLTALPRCSRDCGAQQIHHPCRRHTASRRDASAAWRSSTATGRGWLRLDAWVVMLLHLPAASSVHPEPGAAPSGSLTWRCPRLASPGPCASRGPSCGP